MFDLDLHRVRFAKVYALRHAALTLAAAVLAAFVVFGLWYPFPFRTMFKVVPIFCLVVLVDFICGPCLTFIVSSPAKKKSERYIDFAVIGTVQLLILAYGIHTLWIGRPAVLAFERDRLVVLAANEIESDELHKAPEGMRRLPLSGVLQVGTRRSKDNKEFFQSIDVGLAGISPGMRPGWWEPMSAQVDEIRAQAKPLSELISRRPEAAKILSDAARKSGNTVDQLVYLPLTSRKDLDWSVLMKSSNLEIVGYAPVEGF